jgi:hypothetical protein
MKFNHRAVEQESTFVRKAFCDDLVSCGQPLVQRNNVDIGHDQIDIRMPSRWLQPEELSTPSTDEGNPEAGRFDESEGLDRQRTAVHPNSLARARNAERHRRSASTVVLALLCQTRQSGRSGK